MIVIISILLENIFNIYFHNFYNLFTLISLIFINIEEKKKYYLYSFFIGFIYDIFFTNFILLNAILFFIISIVIYYELNTHKKDLFHYVITGILVIFLYEFMHFIILNLFQYTKYSLIEFSFIARKYLITNIIYLIMLYFINKKHIIN